MNWNIPWDEVNSLMRENFVLELDAAHHTLKILLKGEIPEAVLIENLVQSEEGLKQMASIFLGDDIEFTVEVLEKNQGLLLRFEDDESMQRMHEFLDGLLFGGRLKEIVEQLVKALFEVIGENDTPSDSK